MPSKLEVRALVDAGRNVYFVGHQSEFNHGRPGSDLFSEEGLVQVARSAQSSLQRRILSAMTPAERWCCSLNEMVLKFTRQGMGVDEFLAYIFADDVPAGEELDVVMPDPADELPEPADEMQEPADEMPDPADEIHQFDADDMMMMEGQTLADYRLFHTGESDGDPGDEEPIDSHENSECASESERHPPWEFDEEAMQL